MEIFWIVCGIVVAALLVATVVIITSSAAHKKEIKRSADATAEIAAGESAAGQEELAGSANADAASPAAETAIPDNKTETIPVENIAEDISAEDDHDPQKTDSQSAESTEMQPEEPQLEIPEKADTRITRLRRKLAARNNPFARGLLSILAADKIAEETWEDFETVLISADLGVGPAEELISALRKELSLSATKDAAAAKAALEQELVKLVNPNLDRSLNIAKTDPDKPAVVLVVGVNGVGKTTSVGKLGRLLKAENNSVIFGAADTFRAAAAEQLTTWGERIGVETISAAEGADPSSVAFEAVRAGIEKHADVVLVDTAGRLHTKVGLMDELGKIKRVIEKQAAVTEVLLVVDATTGQNGLIQAKIFAQATDITGIVLTKLDGSAKGGIAVQIQRELNVPVKFIGLGEGADDLAPFSAEEFVSALLAEN